MLRQKPLFISLMLAGLVAAQNVSALGLGRLNVTTALGQPLVADVDLTVNAGDEVDSIRANIATPAAYKTANVEYQGVLQNIRVQVLKRANGQPYLRLTSNQSINEPYLDVLVEVNSNTGKLVREFVLLLDPPGAPAAIAETQQPARPSMPLQTAPAPAPISSSAPAPTAQPAQRASTPAPRAPAPAASGNGTSYAVRSGDSLFGIASRNKGSDVSVEQLMIAIQRANPQAFISGNINRLRSGVTLEIPSSSDASAITQSTAATEVRAQASSWRGYVARVSEGVPTVSSDQPQARASGKVSGAVTDTGGGAPTGDKLKLSAGDKSKQAATENKIATAKALEEEKSRIAQLQKTKETAEKAVALQNQAMADAQAKAKEAAKAVPAPIVAPVPTPVAAAPAPVEAPKVAEAAPAPIVTPAPEVTPPLPAPAPAPMVAKKAPEPVKADDGMLSFLGDDPLLPLGIGGAAVLAGLGGWMWSRRKSKSKGFADTSAPAGATLTTMNPDTVFGTSGLGVVKTNDAPIASQFSRSGMGTIDAGEVDPVAEAEVYIAYGREAQAEEILREALNRDPQRADVATKLAEITATQGKREAFDALAKQIGGMDRGAEFAPRLSEIAAANFPGHAMSASTALKSAGAAVGESLGSAGPTAAAAVDSVKSSASMGVGAAVAGLAATGAAAAAAVGLSKSATAPATANSSLDFVLDSAPITATKVASAPAAASAASLSMGDDAFLKSFDVPPAPAVAAKADPNSGKRKSLEDDLADLEASLQKATQTGQLPESSLDFTDFSTATPTNLGPAAPAMRPEMLDLSFDASRQNSVDPTPSILDGQWHDVSTKLDLARAYEEMGDREGAREILREVMHDGNDVQQKEAKALLAKLGG